MKEERKIAVAISGGIDSAVAAYLLKKQGWKVQGITLWLFGGEERIKRAEEVCKQIGISHRVIDLRQSFKEIVIGDFCSQYQQGRTPNPCILCNQNIKFGSLVFKEIEERFRISLLASGHYARIEKEKGGYLLKTGRDKRKDQSYFLYALSQEQLSRLFFPLGELTKEEVKRIAKGIGLRVDASESQQVCFLEGRDYREFLKGRIKEASKGLIVDKKERVIGEHQGIAFYTIGQRKRLGAFGRPVFVIDIDAQRNLIKVGERKDLYRTELIAEQVNWISQRELSFSLKAKARIRYQQELSSVSLFPLEENKVRVKFEQPQFAITPGQAIVFYDGDIVLGGGKILSSN